MRRVARLSALTIVGLILSAPFADAAGHIEFIDTGTPKNGTVEMTGWRGVIVRVTLDDNKKITRMNFGLPPGEIYGSIAQRREDPTGGGNYTQDSPGPHPANNSLASEFNFDTHFLGTTETYTLLGAVLEDYPSGFFPAQTGIPSTLFVGYGGTLSGPSRDLSQGGHLGGVLEVAPAFQSNSMDVVYVVTNDAFFVHGQIESGNEIFGVTDVYVVPEPTAFGLLSVFASRYLLRRRPRKASRRAVSLEQLEGRVHLSVPK